MLARHEGRVVLVAGAIPGERVRVARRARRRATSRGPPSVEVLEPSPDRREPPGDPACGGAATRTSRTTASSRSRPTSSPTRSGASARSRSRGRCRVRPSPEHGLSPARAAARATAARGLLPRRHARAVRRRRHGPAAAGDDDGAWTPRWPRSMRGWPTCDALIVAENVAATERVLHLEPRDGARLDDLAGSRAAAAWRHRRHDRRDTVTRRRSPGRARSPTRRRSCSATTRRSIPPTAWTRHATSFFQGNRFLTGALVRHVLEARARRSLRRSLRGRRTVRGRAGGARRARARGRRRPIERAPISRERRPLARIALRDATRARRGGRDACRWIRRPMSSSLDPPRTGVVAGRARRRDRLVARRASSTSRAIRRRSRATPRASSPPATRLDIDRRVRSVSEHAARRDGRGVRSVSVVRRARRDDEPVPGGAPLRRGRSNSVANSPVRQKFSGCHCTPTQKSASGFSIASMTPSGAVAETTNPGAAVFDGLMMPAVDRDAPVARARAASSIARHVSGLDRRRRARSRLAASRSSARGRSAAALGMS